MAKPIKETICVRLSPVLMAALRGWVRLHQKSFSGGIEVLVVEGLSRRGAYAPHDFMAGQESKPIAEREDCHAQGVMDRPEPAPDTVPLTRCETQEEAEARLRFLRNIAGTVAGSVSQFEHELLMVRHRNRGIEIERLNACIAELEAKMQNSAH